jgi:lysozyme
MMHARDENLLNLIKFHEGWAPYPRKDIDGLTVGYGHNLLGCPLSRRVGMFMMQEDLQVAWDECAASIPAFAALDDTRKAVLVDMRYNLGLRSLLRFVKMLEAVADGDYTRAADEILDSTYAAQVPNRALRLSTMMKTGEWPDIGG